MICRTAAIPQRVNGPGMVERQRKSHPRLCFVAGVSVRRHGSDTRIFDPRWRSPFAAIRIEVVTDMTRRQRLTLLGAILGSAAVMIDGRS